VELTYLLPRFQRARRSGHGYVALCPGHDDRHQSLSITQVGDRILLHCFADCSVEVVCAAVGIRMADLFAPSSGNSTSHWTEAERRAYARQIWLASRSASGTVVAVYLRSRAITVPTPPAIRFRPLLKHRDYGWPFPAMVAGLQGPDDKFAAVSVTWLAADGSDKAPVDPPRKIYGPYRGAVVRLGGVGERLVVCEGLETGLSITQARPEPVWCALSATNLPHVNLPKDVHEVVIAADADGPAKPRRARRRNDGLAKGAVYSSRDRDGRAQISMMC
jgi:putative DNA primase/helicase